VRTTAAAIAGALALALGAAAPAAAFTLRSDVDARKLGVQDQVHLTITVEGTGGPDEVPMPALQNLQVVAGPSQSTQVSLVNGRLSQSRSFTYVLQPQAEGPASIGAVRAGDQAAPAIELEVVAGSIRPRARQRGGIDPFSMDPFGGDPFGDPFEEMMGRPRGRSTTAKVFVEAQPSRTRLYVGEPLVLTYYLYTQVSVSDLQLKDAPQYAGFWAEDLERGKGPPAGEPATVGGESYRRFPFLKKLLFATKAGALTLPPATFKIGIARQGFFDAGGSVERATKPVTVAVQPLPEAPGFSGAVGRFTSSASVDREVVPLGEAVTLRFRVAGAGNLKWIDRGPEVTVAGARVYPPQQKTELRTTEEGVSGSRTWEFVVVPQTTGDVQIPSLPFSYFDPQAGKIVGTETPPIAVRVEGGTLAAGLPVPPPTQAAAARGTGALPLRTELDRRPAAALGLSGRTLLLVAGAVLLLHAGLWAAGQRGGRPGPGRTRAASSRSVRAALADLERARDAGLSKEQSAALVEKGLHEAFGALDDADDSDRARAVRAILEDVRFVRYAPQLGDYSQATTDLAARAAETVRRWA
jgi:hypothetical protein